MGWEATHVHRIDSKLLIPGGDEKPILDATIVFEGNRILYVGTTAAPPSRYQYLYPTSVPCVMPDIWDTHCHFHGICRFSLEDMLMAPKPTATARAAKEAEAALQAGVTSVRETGDLGSWLRPAIAEGKISGPTIYSARSVLSQTGRRADVHGVSGGWVAHYCESDHFLELYAGVPEYLRAVKLQLRNGAGIIEICGSGGITSTIDDLKHQQFLPDELRAMVKEAGRAECNVTAHCHGKPGIIAARETGVKTIEHGSYLDEECAQAMIEAETILVPTRFIIERMLLNLELLPQHAVDKVRCVAAYHLEAIGHAVDAGVVIAAGTNIGTTGSDSLPPWGANDMEAESLHPSGLNAEDAFAAITSYGHLALAQQAPRSAALKVGFDANAIGLTTNPLLTLVILGRPDVVTRLWKSGNLVTSAGDPISQLSPTKEDVDA